MPTSPRNNILQHLRALFLAVIGAGGAGNGFVHQRATEVVNAGIETGLDTDFPHLHPGALNIVDLRVQRQPRHRVHQQRLAEGWPLARLAFQVNGRLHWYKRQWYKFGKAAGATLHIANSDQMARPVNRPVHVTKHNGGRSLQANFMRGLDHLQPFTSIVLGIGSGWQKNEHDAYGIEYGTAGYRLKKLGEACQIFKGLFNNDYFDFDGEFYQLKNASMQPKPKQERLPLMIGGGGEKVTLRLVAKYADEWNIWGDVDALIHKMNVLDQHCAEIGRDPK